MMSATPLGLMRRLLVAAALWLALPAAMADDWIDGRNVFKTCVACHGVNIAGPAPNLGAALASYGNDTAALQSNINNPPNTAMAADAGVRALATCAPGTYPCASTALANNDAVRKLGVYLANPNRGAGQVTAAASVGFSPLPAARGLFSSSVDITLTASNDPDASAYLPNFGHLDVTAASLSDTTNFETLANDCDGASLAPGAHCTYRFRFRPQQVGNWTGRTLTFNHNGALEAGASKVLSNISGTGQEPRPTYIAGAGFAALSSGFTTDTAGSVTLCPTIRNTGLYDALSVSLQALPSGAGDYTGYYEIDNSPSACTSPPARCLPSGATSVAGSFSVAPGASCTLALKFNPGKFGFSGGTGARPAQVQVTHNGYTTASPVSYPMGGLVNSGPIPRIGVSTTPSANPANQVLPAPFASQVVGTASAAWSDFTVANTGTADGLQIASVSWDNHAEFGLTQTCTSAGPLARLSTGGASCGVSLVFTPAAAPAGLGQRCTAVTVHASFPDIADLTVDVCGTGVAVPVPVPSVDPTAIDFGRRSIGAVYLPRTLTIANGSGATANLRIDAVTIVGSGFAFQPDAAACAGHLLARDEHCSLSLQFTPGPTPETAYGADILIDSNDPATPRRTVHLSATAVAAALPVLQWDSGLAGVTFPGLVLAGQASATAQVARIVNAGPGATDLQEVRLVGPDASSFNASGCPAQLFEGESCEVRVSFLPGSGGAKQAQLVVATAGGVAPASIPVTGQAVGGSSPFLLASMANVDFGAVRVGAQSQPVELQVTAAGDGVVTVTSLTVQGPFAISSVSCPPMPFALRLGTSCTVAVRYLPTDTATATGALTLTAEAPARALSVKLEGNAQAAPDTSGGGCSLVDGRPAAAFDATLWLLLSAAAAGVLLRRRAADRKHGNPRR